MMQNENEIEQLYINEEHKIWKKNTPHLYDLIISHTLEWPSLTVEWLPGRNEPDGQDYVTQKLILGTYTDGDYPNYLMIAEVKLPVEAEGDLSDAQGFDSSDDKVCYIRLPDLNS
ncbi:G-protein beta WD-40 repeat-containing protein [Artemisia annua]|uniref:G-protein beta WD-40 repeat-containing protein n=1 Tax=Artemisia annua TaxID=35608 RepID=A0A2U1K8P7_ARTAN|nr:G-protein beta WD-40 repeat-containing protein [Artemisia annua]